MPPPTFSGNRVPLAGARSRASSVSSKGCDAFDATKPGEMSARTPDEPKARGSNSGRGPGPREQIEMTTFPGSPRVLKGALVSVDPLVPIPNVIIFQYNPDTLTRTLKPRSAGGGAARAEAQLLTGPPEETIKVDVEIDAADQLEQNDGIASTLGIYPQLSALEMLSYPKSSLA